MISSKRHHSTQITAATRDVSESSHGDGSAQLHTLVTGVTGGVDGKVSLAALSLLDALLVLELHEISINEFHQALKTDELSEVIVLRLELKLCHPFFSMRRFLMRLGWH